MGLLDQVTTGRVIKPPRVLLYGTPGIGKSTWASNAPNPIFMPTEDGVENIDVAKFPLFQHWCDFRAALHELATAPHGYETCVIDSLDWLERIIWAQVCSDAGAESIDKIGGGFGRGERRAVAYWDEVLHWLNKMRDDRNMIIILIAHSDVKRFEDPETSPYDRYEPRLHKYALPVLTEWVDAVLFATKKIRTKTEDAGFGKTRTIATAIGQAGGERIVRTVGGPTCVAKNRYGLDADLDLDWNEFYNAIASTY